MHIFRFGFRLACALPPFFELLMLNIFLVVGKIEIHSHGVLRPESIAITLLHNSKARL